MADVALEQQFTSAELAAKWKLSRDTIIRMFRDEPGVFKLANEGRRKRSHVTLRIPASVAVRVYERRAR